MNAHKHHYAVSVARLLQMLRKSADFVDASISQLLCCIYLLPEFQDAKKSTNQLNNQLAIIAFGRNPVEPQKNKNKTKTNTATGQY